MKEFQGYEQSVLQIFENLLVNNFKLPQDSVKKQMQDISKTSEIVANSQDPEIIKRLELFADTTEEEFSDVINDMAHNLRGLKEEEQLLMVNEFLKFFGFKINKKTDKFEVILVDIAEIEEA